MCCCIKEKKLGMMIKIGYGSRNKNRIEPLFNKNTHNYAQSLSDRWYVSVSILFDHNAQQQ